MNENIFWTVSCKIKDGQLDNLKSLRDELVESAKANEACILNYEWFISADEKNCNLYERYSDPAATVLYLKLFVKNYAKRFLEVLEVKNYTVYGVMSDELKEMLTPMGVNFMNPFGGFKR